MAKGVLGHPNGYVPAAVVVVVVILLSADIVAMQFVVESLPGFPGKLPFKLETGYIGVGETEDVQLFYYFTESERNPKIDPLMLWLTGGPGCTSFTGLAYEIGPLRFNYSAFDWNVVTLELNPYSWTKVSSIIFLDSPVGAGFSYSNTFQGWNSSDTIAAAQVYTFLRKWLIDHPKFISNPLYIGGDSYSGKVVPLIVQEIIDGNRMAKEPVMDLKGYVLGNPLTDRNVLGPRIEYAHRVTLVSDELYESVKTSCRGDYTSIAPNNTQCHRDLGAINDCIGALQIANILENACSTTSPRPEVMKWDRRSLEENPSDFLRFPIPEYWCRHYTYYLSYVWANDKLVQDALHVRQGTIKKWIRCNNSISYDENIASTVAYHQNLTKEYVRALIYSGDQDLSIPYVGTIQWIRSLGVSVSDEWRPWFVDGQVSGYTFKLERPGYSLTFATVKGGGHTAPEYKHKECLAMINRWFALDFQIKKLNIIKQQQQEEALRISDNDLGKYQPSHAVHTSLHCCFTGRVHDVEVIPSLQQRLRKDGLPSCQVRYMGDDLVLLSSPDADLLQLTVMEDAKRWAKWLAENKPWTKTHVCSRRAMWLRCDGVLFCMRRRRSFELVRVLILMPEVGPIKDFVQIKVNGHLFSIKVEEESDVRYVWPMSELQANLQRESHLMSIVYKRNKCCIHEYARYIGVGELDEVQLFYYFIKSERNPKKDLVLLWFGGGPSCSAFYALVLGKGPLSFNHSDDMDWDLPQLHFNPYSWTKVANIIFVDTPVGIGFSYATTSAGYETNDTLSSACIYEFVRKWLMDHPEFLKNPLFIGGDSYAAKMTPLFIQHIVNVTYEEKDINSRVLYAHHMALLSDELYKCLRSVNIMHILEPKCNFVPYNHTLMVGSKASSTRMSINEYFLYLTSHHPGGWCRAYNHWPAYIWANDKKVQEVLHVREGTVKHWFPCNKSLSYTKNIESVVGFHQNLTKKGIRALFYSGDHDMAIPYVGTQAWIKSLNVSMSNYWRYTVSYTDKYYSLTFATVKGAGHTAPEYKPQECFAMVERWLAYNLL
ncbi:hypothetical protein Ancab_017588 [Ancistrocladus abbreviatus]